MHFSLLSVLAFMAIPLRVVACEGDCIVDITNAFLGNYSYVVETVMAQTGDAIIRELNLTDLSPKELMHPIMTAYANESYMSLETAIFPGYFHGKCQDLQTGVDPEGCPNPDCPVVCGTPGSLVHFYSKLRYIAFNDTRHLLASCASASTSSVEDIAFTHQPRSNSDTTLAPRILRFRRAATEPSASREDVNRVVQDALKKIPDQMNVTCGGSGYPNCSWEKAMKEYILTFP
ncbi:hypothetical protein C8R46DRAFT_1185202 [Mycena filopes]|nr:hypothetical protein C8R46DRAFT_1185202 [Mycena filopes]